MTNSLLPLDITHIVLSYVILDKYEPFVRALLTPARKTEEATSRESQVQLAWRHGSELLFIRPAVAVADGR
jgi:hypothetical protein